MENISLAATQNIEPQIEHPLVEPVYATGNGTIEYSKPFLGRASEARSMDVPGQKTRVLLGAAHTNGSISVASCEVAPDAGPPPHIHTHEDEIFLMQSGSVEFFVNGEYIVANAGDVVFAARGEAHTFRGLDSATPNRFTIVFAPSHNFEAFYAGWEPLIQDPQTTPDQLVAHAANFGITLLAPDAPVPIVQNPRSKIVRAGTRRVLDVGTANLQVMLSAHDTGGRYGLVYAQALFEQGTPPHVHSREDEIFIIEKGTLALLMDGETQLAHAGDAAWGPRGVPHAFRIASEEGATFWGLITPGGFESYFHRCAALGEANNVTMENMVALLGEYGIAPV